MKYKIFVLSIFAVVLMGCTQEQLAALNATDISMEVLKSLEPEFESLRNQLDAINKSLWLESEGHYLEVINTIDKSVVEVRAHPPLRRFKWLQCCHFYRC
ncbi:MAG TPA: hypothetical protein ENI29_14680 [bacterium]|nr:hypothetical protein [bacterium]